LILQRISLSSFSMAKTALAKPIFLRRFRCSGRGAVCAAPAPKKWLAMAAKALQLPPISMALLAQRVWVLALSGAPRAMSAVFASMVHQLLLQQPLLTISGSCGLCPIRMISSGGLLATAADTLTAWF
jgi:hypothetical protein